MSAGDSLVHAANKLQQTLETITIKDFIKQKKSQSFRPLVSAEVNTSVEDFLKLLADEQIVAAPIYENTSAGRIFKRIVSVHDILSAAVFPGLFDKADVMDSNNAHAAIQKVATEQFFAAPISSVLVSFESEFPFILSTMDHVSSLLMAFTMAGYHRLLVLDCDLLAASLVGPIPSSAAITVVSQSDLVRFLLDSGLESSAMEALFDAPVSSITRDLERSLVSISPEYYALEGFRIMHMNKVTAVPIVEKNEVVATLSDSDLRGLTRDNMSKLVRPVFEYLESESRKGGVTVDQVRTVQPGDTVRTAAQTMLQNGIHRLWVQGEPGVLENVVSLTDILTFMSK